ncbi:hypothetical protein [Brevibacillus sp. 179-C9.3 HS]|uniref:hypothetical protein n=1 Tax=unclassified Brevibacillus TaxID=2684853 RepID=UPI0039A3414F
MDDPRVLFAFFGLIGLAFALGSVVKLRKGRYIESLLVVLMAFFVAFFIPMFVLKLFNS